MLEENVMQAAEDLSKGMSLQEVKNKYNFSDNDLKELEKKMFEIIFRNFSMMSEEGHRRVLKELNGKVTEIIQEKQDVSTHDKEKIEKILELTENEEE